MCCIPPQTSLKCIIWYDIFTILLVFTMPRSIFAFKALARDDRTLVRYQSARKNTLIFLILVQIAVGSYLAYHTSQLSEDTRLDFIKSYFLPIGLLSLVWLLAECHFMSITTFNGKVAARRLSEIGWQPPNIKEPEIESVEKLRQKMDAEISLKSGGLLTRLKTQVQETNIERN